MNFHLPMFVSLPDTRNDSKYVHFQVVLSSQIEIGFRVKVEPWSSIHQKCAKVTYRFFSWTREETGMRDSIPEKCRTFSLYSCFLVPFRFPRCLLLWFQADAFLLCIFSSVSCVVLLFFVSGTNWCTPEANLLMACISVWVLLAPVTRTLTSTCFLCDPL